MASGIRSTSRGTALAALLAVAIAFHAEQAGAQAETAPLAGAEAPACELHVWPTGEIDSRSSGWLSLFGLVGTAIDRAQSAPGNRRRRDAIAEVLDPPTQVRLIAGTDPSHLLPIRRSRLVLHEEPVAPRDLRARRTRRAVSASPCYAELYVRRIRFRRTPLDGRALVAGFALRRFGADQEVALRLDGEGDQDLTRFPPRDEAGAAAAADDLRASFTGAFRRFAVDQLMRAPPTP